VSYWYTSFKSAFFRAWVSAGLPDPEQVSRDDLDYWRAEQPPTEWHQYLRESNTRALQCEVISTVYGFGCFIGRVCGELFGLGQEQAATRAHWCGRFNLGISLFDFVCDELPQQTRSAMLALPVFAPFSGNIEMPEYGDAGEVGQFLEVVAAGVMEELAREVGAPTAHRMRYGLWLAFRNMYRAQLAAASRSTHADANTTNIIQFLRLKSSEPFRVMSEWMARSAGSGVSARKAAHFGRRLGDCFWLVDDARDVWADLDGGRWNYFLARAVAADPTLPLDARGPVLEAQLVRKWVAGEVPQQASRQTVTNFSGALQGLGQAPELQRQAASRLVASIARWAR
jgi:hypothetical protein